MKNKLKSIATVFTLVLMFTIFGTSVLAASTTVTETSSFNWRGNGTKTNRDVDEMAIGKGETVKLATKLKFTLDPKTASHNVDATVELRQKHWYGHTTVICQRVCDGLVMSNSDATDEKTYSYATSQSTTITATGDYYIVAKTANASRAFYNDYYFTTTYTVGN